MLELPKLLATPREVDELCDQFEDELRRGAGPEIDAWLAKAGSHAEAALRELAVLHLDYRLRAGEAATAADYFDQFPQLLSNPAAAIRLIATEYRTAVLRNPHVSETDFCRRYPELARCPEWSNGPWIRPAGVDRSTDQLRGRPGESTVTAGDSGSPFDPMGFLRTILAPSDRPGDLGRLGDYRVLDVLGAGGMGVVLRAEEETLGRPVALKLMRPEVAAKPFARNRFLREARAAAAVVHPRVVVIHHVGEVNGIPFLVMPLLAGQSLGHRLETGPPVPASEVMQIARETAEGLVAAHARGLIHRDIKPDNIWLEETPEGVHVRLLDFGLARGGEDEILTNPGVVVGTPYYMAPEQAAAGSVDPRTDLFSLGCVLYELTTGKRAFAGRDLMAVLSALANHQPRSPQELNPAIPAALSDLVIRLLAKNPAERCQSAAEVVTALRAIEAGQTDAPPPVRSIKTPMVWPRRRRWGMAAAVLALVMCCGVVGWLMTGSVDQRPPQRGPDAVAPSAGENAPLRVVSIDVYHVARLKDQDGEDLGILGKRPPETKAPKEGDQVTVKARLSRAAFAYLLAFRPDGEVELCSPKEEDQPPTRDDQVRYPTKTESADLRYGLQEGTGLWVFAVVASDDSLPAYREWKSTRKLSWSTEPGGQGKVWWYDGDWLEQMSGPGTVGGQRAKGEQALGPGKAVVQAANQLRVGKVVTAAIGFGVGPRN